MLLGHSLVAVFAFVYTTQVAEAGGEPYVPDKPLVRVPSGPRSNLLSDGTPSGTEKFKSVRQPNNLYAWTSDHDHEDAGIETGGGGGYTGVFAVHSVYAAASIVLNTPVDATRTQTLFAPTTRPPNGSCLEAGTAYEMPSNGKRTNATFYIYDFCKTPPGFFKADISGTFIETYAGAQISDVPAYVVSIFTPVGRISHESIWYAEIFNYQSRSWEYIYSSRGFFRSDPRGWSIFETWYNQGQCSQSLPTFSATELAFFNALSQEWEPLRHQMHGLSTYLHGGSNCFEDDEHGDASYALRLVAPDTWQVSSSGQ
jgi:hypothetical protein